MSHCMWRYVLLNLASYKSLEECEFTLLLHHLRRVKLVAATNGYDSASTEMDASAKNIKTYVFCAFII